MDVGEAIESLPSHLHHTDLSLFRKGVEESLRDAEQLGSLLRRDEKRLNTVFVTVTIDAHEANPFRFLAG